MSVNIKDVAKKAGVSITTVSRVINNNPVVNEKTKLKVNAVMEELNYYPHQIARALSKKQSFIIGILIPDCANPFFAEIIKYVELYAQNKDYKLLVCNSLNNKEKEIKYIQMLEQNRVDGIIMGSHTLDVDAYKNLNAPIITFDRYIDENIPYVSSDNFYGGQLATNALIESGCQSLLHISGALHLNTFANRRAEAFKLTCIENKVNFQILELEHTKLSFEYFMGFINEKIAPILPNIDGVFCSNDLLAYALYIYCTQNNIRVPQDLKIIGYDYNSFIRMLKTPQITTIAQPVEKIANALCSGLIQLIENPDDSNVHNKVISVHLVKGDTV